MALIFDPCKPLKTRGGGRVDQNLPFVAQNLLYETIEQKEKKGGK
jgi:hypothetical protein